MEFAGWNQTETAKRLGITPSAVSKILSGENTPEERTLILLRTVVNLAKPEHAKVGPVELALRENAPPWNEPWERMLIESIRNSPRKKAMLRAIWLMIDIFEADEKTTK